MGLELLGAGASLLGNLFASNSASNAASSAAAAQQGAITDALGHAQTGFNANQSTIRNTGGAGSQYLDSGYSGAKDALDPMIQAGGKARDYYANATGVNGEDARSAYMKQLMSRPEYAAANNYAMQGVQQQYGNRLGSGALARSMQTRQTQFAQGAVNNDLKNVEPLVQAGNQAGALQASNAQQLGTNQAANTWKTGNAFVGNQNALTNDYMQGALGRGNVAANQATTQGQLDSNAFSNIGNTVGRLIGGTNGASAFTAFS